MREVNHNNYTLFMVIGFCNGFLEIIKANIPNYLDTNKYTCLIIISEGINILWIKKDLSKFLNRI